MIIVGIIQNSKSLRQPPMVWTAPRLYSNTKAIRVSVMPRHDHMHFECSTALQQLLEQSAIRVCVCFGGTAVTSSTAFLIGFEDDDVSPGFSCGRNAGWVVSCGPTFMCLLHCWRMRRR